MAAGGIRVCGGMWAIAEGRMPAGKLVQSAVHVLLPVMRPCTAAVQSTELLCAQITD